MIHKVYEPESRSLFPNFLSLGARTFSLTHSLTHSLTYSLTRSLTHPLTHPTLLALGGHPYDEHSHSHPTEGMSLEDLQEMRGSLPPGGGGNPVQVFFELPPNP